MQAESRQWVIAAQESSRLLYWYVPVQTARVNDVMIC